MSRPFVYFPLTMFFVISKMSVTNYNHSQSLQFIDLQNIKNWLTKPSFEPYSLGLVLSWSVYMWDGLWSLSSLECLSHLHDPGIDLVELSIIIYHFLRTMQACWILVRGVRRIVLTFLNPKVCPRIQFESDPLKKLIPSDPIWSYIRPCPHVSGFVCTRKHFVMDLAFVHTYPAKTHTVAANFWKCNESGHVWTPVTANLGKRWHKSAEIAHPHGALSW